MLPLTPPLVAVQIYLQPWAANEAAALSGPTPQADAGAAGKHCSHYLAHVKVFMLVFSWTMTQEVQQSPFGICRVWI